MTNMKTTLKITVFANLLISILMSVITVWLIVIWLIVIWLIVIWLNVAAPYTDGIFLKKHFDKHCGSDNFCCMSFCKVTFG
jgi:hypothetical protein